MSLSNGKPQFEVVTWVNAKQIGKQTIHDPFINTTVRLRGLRHAWTALTKGLIIEVNVDGTPGAISEVMSLSPEKIELVTANITTSQTERRCGNDFGIACTGSCK